MHFYKLFELKCVLAVCVHNHPIIIKIHPVFFFNLVKSFPLSQIEPISDACLCVTQTGPSHDCLIDSSVSAQTGLVSYLSPALSELSSVRYCWCRHEWLLSDWGVLLLDVIMNTAVLIYSRHLSHWRRSGLHLFMKGMRPPIYLNVSIFARIIRDPASPPEEVSVRFFYESLQIAFPNNVLISKFHDECG